MPTRQPGIHHSISRMHFVQTRPKIIRDQTLLRTYHCTNILCIPMSSLTLDVLTSKSTGVLSSIKCSEYQVWCLSSKRFSLTRYLGDNVFLCPALPLTFHVVINRGHWLIRKYQFNKFDVCQTKGSQGIEGLTYSYVYAAWPLTFHLIINKSHWLTGMYQFIKFKIIKQRVFKTLSGQYIPISSFTFDLKIHKGNWFYRLYQCTKFDVRLRILSGQSCLTLDLLISKSIGVIYSLRCTSVQNLNSIKQSVLKILSGQYIHMSSMTPDLWTS
jgi:hypothetical protein